MKRRMLALLLVFSMVVPFLPARVFAEAEGPSGTKIWYVTENGAGDQDGSSWTNASPKLAEVMDEKAQAGDQIWVAAGTYSPGGYETYTFNLKRGLKVYGGFAGNEASLDQRDWETNVTILSGNNVNYHVVTGGTDAAPEDTCLDGFIVTGGNANDCNGGGMFNDQSSPTVANCTFTGNSTTYFGGGIYNEDSSPTIANCTFSANSADYCGGGIYNKDSSPTVTNCTFTENTADEGGGIYNNNSNPILVNCTLSANSASVTAYGGGIYSSDNSSPRVANTILWANTAGLGPNIYQSGGALTLDHCVVENYNSDVTPDERTLIQDDPLLVPLDKEGNQVANPTENPAQVYIFSLQDGSSALNAGLAVGDLFNGVSVPAVDQLGTDRPQGTGVDIGAFEWTPDSTYVLHIKDKDYTDQDLAADIDKLADEGWSWKAETNTLTLANYEGGYIRYSEEGEAERDITIRAKDGTNNTITVPVDVDEHGIYAHGNITLSGDGNVSFNLLNDDPQKILAAIRSENSHVAVDMAGNLDITGVKYGGIKSYKNVTLSGEGKVNITTSNNGIGSNSGDIIFSGGGDVTIVSDDNDAISAKRITHSGSGDLSIETNRMGIDAWYVTFSGSGDINIKSDWAGILALYDVTFSGNGDVSITADGYGILTRTGDVIHSGTGKLTVKAGEDAVYLETSGKELKLNGTGTPLTFTAGENKKAIYNSADGTSPVGGDNFANYTPTGRPEERTVQYDLNPSSYSVTAQCDPDKGTAVADPGQASAGTQVNLTATALDGYEFRNWEVVSGGANLEDSNAAQTRFIMPAENVVIKAHFETTPAQTFKVTYKGNGNDGGQVPTDLTDYVEGATVTVMGPGNLTKTGHSFSGWNTASDGSGTDYEEGATLSMPAKDMTLYAQWEEQSLPDKDYQLTVTGGEGSGRYKAGETVTLIANSPSEGQEFKEWDISSEVDFVEGTDKTSSVAKFTMPAEDVQAKATYQTLSDLVSVTRVRLNKTYLRLPAGTSQSLTATVYPDNATNKEVTWTSSDESIATVNEEGQVTGVKPGRATINVTTKDGGKTARCTVRVTRATQPIPVTGVSLNKDRTRLLVGETEKLEATVSPANAANKNLDWESDKPEVATVDIEGNVTAVGPGTATITVTTKDGQKTATCSVEVLEAGSEILVTGVTLNKTSTSLTVGRSEKLEATVSPTNATNQKVKWTSDKENVASVDEEGLVTAKATGTATITATTEDGEFIATCTVRVTRWSWFIIFPIFPFF